MGVVLEGGDGQHAQRLHGLGRVLRLRADAVHQQANRQHGIFFIHVRFHRHFLGESIKGFDAGDFDSFVGDDDVLARRQHLDRKRRWAFGVVGRFESHRRVFLNQLRVLHFNHVKITIFPVLIGNKAEAFVFKKSRYLAVHHHSHKVAQYSAYDSAECLAVTDCVPGI
ncbi:hypothetical protein D3C79_909740 [compost metagenome]